jgi:hypothetical protein
MPELVDRVETLRAYRSVLQRRFDQAAHAALEDVPGGEWDGMQVLRRKELERVIHDLASADPDPIATVAEVETPATVFVDALCPRCELPTRILVILGTELVTTVDGSEIKVKAKAKASSHTCFQLPLEPSDDEQMRLADLTGPTTTVAVFRAGTALQPADVDHARPVEERCGATAMWTDGDDEEQEIVCERLAGHDALLTEGQGDHWAEGGIAWYTETIPAVLSPDAPAEEAIDEGEDDATNS